MAESQLARLTEVLTNPESIRGMTSDEIDVLRSVVSSIHTALGSAFIAAKQREMIAAANPKGAIHGLLDAAEIAKLLSLTKAAVYGLMRSGEIKSVQIGKYRKVPVDALAAYMWKLIHEGEDSRPLQKIARAREITAAMQVATKKGKT